MVTIVKKLKKTKVLHSKGVNFAGPISQMKLDNGKCVVEEHLAKGTTFEKIKIDYSLSSANITSDEIMKNYTEFFQNYLNELKIRAEADQEIYDKLFSDIIEMNKENLTVDTCSLGNLFFDKDIGFSIIDAYPGDKIPNIKNLFWLVVGNIPSIGCKENSQWVSSCIPYSCYNEFIEIYNKITNKFTKALDKIKYNYNLSDFIISYNVLTIDTIAELVNKEQSNEIRISI